MLAAQTRIVTSVRFRGVGGVVLPAQKHFGNGKYSACGVTLLHWRLGFGDVAVSALTATFAGHTLKGVGIPGLTEGSWESRNHQQAHPSA